MLGFNESNDRRAQIARMAEAHQFEDSDIDYIASFPTPSGPAEAPGVGLASACRGGVGLLIGVVGGMMLERAWTAQIAVDAEGAK